MYLNDASLNGDRFPELGNVLKKINPLSGFSGNNSQRSYVYNNDAYPISGTYVSSASKVNLAWKYNCK